MHTQRDATLNFNVTKGMLFLLLFPWFPKWKAWKVSSLRHSDQPVFVLKKLKQTQANSANPVSSLETQIHPRWSPDWSLSVPQLILLWIWRKKRKFHEGTSCIVLDCWWYIIPKRSKNVISTSIIPCRLTHTRSWWCMYMWDTGLLIFATGALSPKECGLERSCTPWP